MTQSDLTFRTDYVDVDPFRFSLIDRMMHNPLQQISFLNVLGEELSNFKNTSYFVETFRNINFEPQVSQKTVPDFQTTSSSLEQLRLPNILPEKVASLTQELLTGIYTVNQHFNWQKKLIPEEERTYLNQYLPMVVLEDEKDPEKTVEELDQQQKIEEEASEKLIHILSQLDLERIYIRAYGMTASLDIFLEKLKKYIESDTNWLKEKAFRKPVLFEKQTKAGRVVIGGIKSNHYSGSYALIIDFGGDDTYELAYDSLNPTSIIIDLDGNDSYKALTDYVLGTGYWGIGILVDENGDDIYQGKNFSLGSGLIGMGILLDKKGKDKYFGDTFTQGAGGLGIGILSDLEGADFYSVSLFGQGFGFIQGWGSLIDYSGNDHYLAGGKYKDILRYKDHYLSLSQGFAYGLRPYMSGGIGVLLDYAGNDQYISDIFGQGSSYWWGWGALLDKEGNDNYISYQYAQGAATHMTLGILMDEAGNDIYSSHGVSQGCGHDYACGILLDKKGNDNYYVESLSQGAGSANGVGILIDVEGQDGYYAQSKDNTQGYGNPRRDYGSIGIFMDLLGKDRYDGNGKDGTWWITNSKWGVGIDSDFDSLRVEKK